MSVFRIALFSPCCPHCKSVAFWGVGIRNSVEGFVYRWLFPYRCCLCGRHFFLFRGQAPLAGTA
jgi:hypothetical protein